MGMPITTYNVLNALDNGDKYQIRAARKALEPFNSFAFIIHDPDADESSDFGQRNRAFDKTIVKNFDYLDHLTGEKLLFFALVDPPKNWLSHAQSRSYYKHLKHQNVRTSNDRSVTAYSLAKSLDIPYEMLPCLVITPYVSNRQAVWVRTCADHVEDQLSWLGYRTSRSVIINAENAFLNDVRKEINFCEGSDLTTLESSLAKALADVMSFIIENDHSDLGPVKRERVQKTLGELKNTLDNLKNTGTSDTEELDNLCEKIVAFLAHLNPLPRQDLADFIGIDMTHLEVDSGIILKTAHMVNDYLANARTRMIDYTPVVICLAKVFEREINLSVVHWIRQNLGVQLPNYFNKHQDRVKAIFDRRGLREIDFNKSDPRGRWHPPAIGESQIAYRQLSREMADWLNEPQNFLTNWDEIRNVRNQAAHTQYVGVDSVKAIQNTLNQLANDNIFETLSQMKRTGRQDGFQLNP